LRWQRAILLQLPVEIEIPLHEISIALKDEEFVYQYQS
jgi:hypothetical protein